MDLTLVIPIVTIGIISSAIVIYFFLKDTKK